MMAARLEKTRDRGVYKRGSKYAVIFRGPDGRQRQRSAGTLAEARALRSEMQADVVRGEYRAQTRETFASYIAGWIITYQGRSRHGVKPETLVDYRRLLGVDETGKPLLVDGQHVNAIRHLGRLRLSEIEPLHVRTYAAVLAARGLSASSIRLYLAPVRAALADAVELGVLRSNPSTGVRVPQPRRLEDEEQVKALTEAELATLVEHTPDSWRLLIELLSESGLRIGEALALEWRDVDTGRKRLTVRRRVYRGRIDTPKSARGRRAVPLSTNLSRALWQRRGAAADDALVFASRSGGYVDPGNLHARVLKPAARAAGVGWCGFHTLRHTAGSRWFARGWNVVQVSKALGHATPDFTMRVYLHDLDPDLPASPFDRPQSATEVSARPAETTRDGESVEPAEAALN